MENFENGLKMALKISENLRECSEIFGKLRKRFKSVFQMFLLFLKIFGKFPGVIGTVSNGSQELKSFGADF